MSPNFVLQNVSKGDSTPIHPDTFRFMHTLLPPTSFWQPGSFINNQMIVNYQTPLEVTLPYTLDEYLSDVSGRFNPLHLSHDLHKRLTSWSRLKRERAAPFFSSPTPPSKVIDHFWRERVKRPAASATHQKLPPTFPGSFERPTYMTACAVLTLPK